MRSLLVEEIETVVGGDGGASGSETDGATNRIVETCLEQGLPDSTKVTVSHTGTGGWEVVGNGTTTTTTITVTATCGDAIEAVGGNGG